MFRRCALTLTRIVYTGAQWWTDYQPVSYILTSKRGNRSQFASMITACHNAGVGVIVGTELASLRALLGCLRTDPVRYALEPHGWN